MVAGGAVILFQAKQLRMREIAPELMQILHPRAAPAIDGLVVIAHREGLHRAARQQLHPGVLDGIRVLELIDQHVPEAMAIVIQQRRLVAPQFERPQQQLREVDHAGARAGLLVVRVQADQLAARRIVAVLEMLGPVALVLVRIDEPLHLAGHPAALIQALRLDEFLDQAQLILGVQDLEALDQARLAPMQPQQPVRNAVEGADPQRLRPSSPAESRCARASRRPPCW